MYYDKMKTNVAAAEKSLEVSGNLHKKIFY